MIYVINTYRIWEITKILQEEPNELFPHYRDSYEEFMSVYSFKVDMDMEHIEYYFDDSVPYEDWREQEYNYLPISVYEAPDDEVREYAKMRIFENEESLKRDKEREIRSLEFRLKQLKDEH